MSPYQRYVAVTVRWVGVPLTDVVFHLIHAPEAIAVSAIAPSSAAPSASHTMSESRSVQLVPVVEHSWSCPVAEVVPWTMQFIAMIVIASVAFAKLMSSVVAGAGITKERGLTGRSAATKAAWE